MPTRRSRAADESQLSLFQAPAAPPAAAPDTAPSPTSQDSHPTAVFTLAGPANAQDPGAALRAEYDLARAIAARIPDSVHFGTSSWSFPGWAGIVYARKASDSTLAREGLREYARHPLLRTVGIDRGYYAPIPEHDLARYAEQLPEGFKCCTKAPELITAPVSLGHGRGTAGAPNPHYLSAESFMNTMGAAFLAAFRAHAGPFVFEFPPVAPEHRVRPDVFARRLDDFLRQLPPELAYSVELRDRAHLAHSEYRAVLAAHRAAHVYNYWSAMPMPAAQGAKVPIDTAPFAVVRLLLKPGTRYDERKQAFAPFDRIAAADEAMRADVVTLLLQALAAGRPIYVLVNNKAEGSAPLSIRALAERLADALAAPAANAPA